jgi:hypothetical protein
MEGVRLLQSLDMAGLNAPHYSTAESGPWDLYLRRVCVRRKAVGDLFFIASLTRPRYE